MVVRQKAAPSEMTGAEFADALTAIGESQSGFARWAGIAGRTIRQHIADVPPIYVMRLLELRQRLHVPQAGEAPTLDELRSALAPLLRPLVEDTAAQGWPKELLAELLAELARDLKVEARQERKAEKAESRRKPTSRKSMPKTIRANSEGSAVKSN